MPINLFNHNTLPYLLSLISLGVARLFTFAFGTPFLEFQSHLFSKNDGEKNPSSPPLNNIPSINDRILLVNRRKWKKRISKCIKFVQKKDRENDNKENNEKWEDIGGQICIFFSLMFCWISLSLPQALTLIYVAFSLKVSRVWKWMRRYAYQRISHLPPQANAVASQCHRLTLLCAHLFLVK